MYLALVEIHHLHVPWTNPFLHSPPLWVPAHSACWPHKAAVTRASFIVCICLPSNTFADRPTETTDIYWTLWWTWQCACVDFLFSILKQSCGYYTFNPDEKVEAQYYLTCPGTLLVSRHVPESTVSTTLLCNTASLICLGGSVFKLMAGLDLGVRRHTLIVVFPHREMLISLVP